MPTIYNKRGLSNALNAVNPVLGSGEIVHVMDTNTLVVGNGSGVFSSLSGINATPLTHSHVVSDITNFNTSVSGLLPTIANSGDNRILTSTGSTLGINAEANLTFDGTNLNLNNQTASTIASFDSSKNLVSLSTATYPSLTELSYVKGVTSALQTQIDTKAATSTTITAGSGLAGGGSLAANRTIDIGQGDGITVSADSIAVDSTVIRTTGVQTMSGAKTFIAQTVFASGTAAAPGISILGDTDTGLCQISSVGTNSLSISTSGVERVRFASNGDVQINTGRTISGGTGGALFGNNGINNDFISTGRAAALSAGWATLRVNQVAAYVGLRLVGDTSQTASYMEVENSSGTNLFTINSAGNVGIGIATPTLNTNGTVLHIHNSTASRASMIRFTNNESGSTATDGLMVGKWSDGTNYVYDYDNYDLVLGAHNGNKVRIHSVGTSFYQSANGTPALGSKNFYAATFENLSAGYGLAIGGVNASTGSAFLQVQNFSTAAAYDLLLQPLGGNVGIGTSSPSTKLDVFGTAGGGATIRINDGTQDLRLYTSNGVGVVGTISNSSLAFHTNNTPRMIITAAGNVDIGSNSDSNPADTYLSLWGNIAGSNTTTGGIRFYNVQSNPSASPVKQIGGIYAARHGDNYGGSLSFLTANVSIASQTLSTRMFIDSTGKVGIGTTTPAELLHVRGAGARAYIYNTTTDAVVIIQGLTPASPWLGAGKSAVQIDVDGWGGFAWQTDVTSGAKLFKLINNGGYGASESTVLTVNANGNVGVGAAPSDKFHVEQSSGFATIILKASASVVSRINFQTTTNSNGYINYDTGAFRFFTDSAGAATERVQIASDGKLYAFNTYGTTVGGTNRDLFIDSGGLIGYVSSIRASKTNIAAIDDVSWLRDLTPVSFFYRRRNEDGTYSDEPDGTLDYGLIAEDVEVVAPELCFYDIIDDNPELRGVHYSKLITPMLKYIQELEKELQNIKNRLSALEGE